MEMCCSSLPPCSSVSRPDRANRGPAGGIVSVRGAKWRRRLTRRRLRLGLRSAIQCCGMSPIARAAGACLLAAALILTPAAEAKKRKKAPPSPTRPVLTVGNNWDGTADLIDPVKFTRLARLNIIPDKDERMAEIA